MADDETPTEPTPEQRAEAFGAVQRTGQKFENTAAMLAEVDQVARYLATGVLPESS